MLRQRILAINYIRNRYSRRNNRSNYSIEDFFNRSLSRLEELSRIIRESDLRGLVRPVVEIRVYLYLYFSISF